MQHKQDKNKHNNATINCNDYGVNYQQSTISEDNTNNKDNDYDYGKHKHRESTQKRRHVSQQATTSNRSEGQGFYDQSQFYDSSTTRTHKTSCHRLSNHCRYSDIYRYSGICRYSGIYRLLDIRYLNKHIWGKLYITITTRDYPPKVIVAVSYLGSLQ